jgi:siroheme synthase
LQSHDVPVEVVCGISSAIAAPAAAGIAVTLRGVSAGFSVVSACLAKNEPYFDWVELLKVPKHTTVTLMGSALASQISKIAIEEGVDAALPVAIVSNASRPNQKTKITDIRGLADFDGIIERPAVLVFGNTVLHRVGLAG